MCTKCCISWSADAEMCKNTELESMDVGPKWKCNGESGSRNGNAAGSLGAVGAKECETSSSAGLLTVARTEAARTPAHRGLEEEDMAHTVGITQPLEGMSWCRLQQQRRTWRLSS